MDILGAEPTAQIGAVAFSTHSPGHTPALVAIIGPTSKRRARRALACVWTAPIWRTAPSAVSPVVSIRANPQKNPQRPALTIRLKAKGLNEMKGAKQPAPHARLGAISRRSPKCRTFTRRPRRPHHARYRLGSRPAATEEYRPRQRHEAECIVTRQANVGRATRTRERGRK